ncbi:N-acetylmuramoyl-L-alanine amidase [Phytohabitans sp. ZYX-F-186]|uniref:N-acetylmuramoyl-L-alanine amidase n=1 Tax=Phytohabitans maris TaxID=3071409 RepID=A0ABU0ZA77_9ACTN|nr:N-acetylmuramoyl-L-alanine amidase [Phytohabitans sp. ZYX-F-186]MDQ7903940.1 N-acetylmuramoyl-L-alanine amidase [Phytohabitans sp. ZYX-F-186]
MARLLWLAQVLRDAGLTVHEVPGWKTRGGSLGTIRGITCHATAGSADSTDSGEIHTLLHGSATAPPPIAQLYLSRTGDWHVVASGKCNHNKVGWAGPNRGFGNSVLLGIEAQHSNRDGEEWTERQYASYVRGVAALARRLDIPVSRIAGHKEHQPKPAPKGEKSTKTDPTFSMRRFRDDVTKALAGAKIGEDVEDMTPEQARQLRDSHFVLAQGVPSPTGAGRVPLHVWAGWMTGAVKALAGAVSHIDDETRKQLQKDLDAIGAQIEGVPGEVLAAVGAGETPEQIAARLREVLGDRAAEVGALLVDG